MKKAKGPVRKSRSLYYLLIGILRETMKDLRELKMP